MLQLRNNREMLDDLLIRLLVRCKYLTRLQYDGIIRSLDTLRDICQLQAKSKTRKWEILNSIAIRIVRCVILLAICVQVSEQFT